MSIEHELVSLDPERLAQAFSVLRAQAQAGDDPTSMMTPSIEQKYTVLNGFADTLRDALWEDAEAGLLGPTHAVAMATGARIALLSLMQYSEAELFQRQMLPAPEAEQE